MEAVPRNLMTTPLDTPVDVQGRGSQPAAPPRQGDGSQRAARIEHRARGCVALRPARAARPPAVAQPGLLPDCRSFLHSNSFRVDTSEEACASQKLAPREALRHI